MNMDTFILCESLNIRSLSLYVRVIVSSSLCMDCSKGLYALIITHKSPFYDSIESLRNKYRHLDSLSLFSLQSLCKSYCQQFTLYSLSKGLYALILARKSASYQKMKPGGDGGGAQITALLDSSTRLPHKASSTCLCCCCLCCSIFRDIEAGGGSGGVKEGTEHVDVK